MAQGSTMSPSDIDWEYVRPVIRRLYIKEERKLDDVMNIMKVNYKHCGSTKMYKARLQGWNIKKNLDKVDTQLLLRMKYEGDTIGKKLVFVLDGQIVNPEKLQRKLANGHPRVVDPVIFGQRKVYCRSPSPIGAPSPGMKLLRTTFENSNLEVWQEPWDENHVLDDQRIDMLPHFLSINAQCHSRLPNSPVLVPLDHLLFNIDTFFNKGFQIHQWITHEKGYLTSPQEESMNVYDPINFYESITTATKLFKKNRDKKARELLGQACRLAKVLLETEQPRTLDYLLNAYLHLLQEGRQDILDVIRTYISDMADALKITHNPWGKIMNLLGKIQLESLNAAILHAWHCTYTAFERYLGRFHRETVQCYLEFVPNAFFTRQDEAERILRQMLSDCKQAFSGACKPQYLDIMVRLGNNLCYQHRYASAEVVATELFEQARATDSYIVQINGLELAAKAQFRQNKVLPASQNLQTAIKMIGDKWGPKDPWRIHDLQRLESWSKKWGNLDEAELLHRDIDELIGADGVD